MKKLLAIFLTLAMCLSLTACKAVREKAKLEKEVITDYEAEIEYPEKVSSANSGKDENKPENVQKPNNQKQQGNTSSKPTSSKGNKTPKTKQTDDSYENIKCVAASGYKKVGILPSNGRAHFVLTVPKDWLIKRGTDGFFITRNSKKIGTVTEGFSLNGQIEAEFEHSANGVTCKRYITKTGVGKYNHVINYSYDGSNYKSAEITLCVPYSELDSGAVYEIMFDMATTVSNKKGNMGAMPMPDGRDKILILGNSFLATSQVGNIFQQMCSESITVESYSMGYGTVSAYANDYYILNRIGTGEFGAVFVCGFYSMADVSNLYYLLNACNNSDTNIAIFPAHNENYSCIQYAKENYPNVMVLDWKQEINDLIGTGIAKSEFCVNDSHHHSTPLAGYVGAHMIYRAIYGRVPAKSSFSQVRDSQLKLLGDYRLTGIVGTSTSEDYMVYKF